MFCGIPSHLVPAIKYDACMVAKLESIYTLLFYCQLVVNSYAYVNGLYGGS
jgi:hypothetical protein